MFEPASYFAVKNLDSSSEDLVKITYQTFATADLTSLMSTVQPLVLN